MKSFITIIFTLIFALESIIPKMDLCEMAKINNLLEHFNSHHDIKHLSVLAFLSLHYGSDKDHDHSKEDDHQNLPFKGHDFSGGTFTIVPFPFIAEMKALMNEAPQQEFYYVEALFIHYPDSIFQPPRRA